MVRISFLTCVFLICLRLVIGWHFFFEGVNKYESTKNEGAETYKPFSSKGYFAEAEGPLGPKIREFLGDDDARTLAKLTLAETSENNPAARLPTALAKEWDEYARRFGDFYQLTDEDKKRVDDKLQQAKADYSLWLTDKLPPPKDKKEADDDPRKNWITGATVGYPALIYRPEAQVQQRIMMFQQFVEKVREDYEKVLRTMGKDVELTRLRTLKIETAKARADLLKDVDDRTKKMKESLATVVGVKLAGYDLGAKSDPKLDDRVLALVTLQGKGAEATIDRFPDALNKQWDEYVAFVRTRPNVAAPEKIDETLREAKIRYVRFLADLDPYTGNKIGALNKSAAVENYRKALADYDETAKKAQQPLTNEEKAQLQAAVDAALENLGSKLQLKAGDKPFENDEYMKALAQLNSAVKRQQEFTDKSKVENSLALEVAWEKVAATLRPATVSDRIEVYKAAIERLREAEKQKPSTDEGKAAVALATRWVVIPRQDFIDDIKLHTDVLRYNLGGFATGKDFDTLTGIIEVEKPKVRFLRLELPGVRQEWLDLVTRWTLLIAGGCLLAGLFTRLACFTCIVFLVNELLANPALPWLPTSPKMEGNYLFVNKNVVELFALLTLITLPTGRWLGLDALLSCIWPFRKRKAK